jgi:hypothetical protein
MGGLTIFVILATLGYVAGRRAERNHFLSINERELLLKGLPTTSSKHPIGKLSGVKKSFMVTGSVVISVDYFKRIIAGLRQLVGGNIRAYDTLLDRARREAILRLKNHALGLIKLLTYASKRRPFRKAAKIKSDQSKCWLTELPFILINKSRLG